MLVSNSAREIYGIILDTNCTNMNRILNIYFHDKIVNAYGDKVEGNGKRIMLSVSIV